MNTTDGWFDGGLNWQMDRILIILKKENGPRASSAPALGLNTIIFKHVYWYQRSRGRQIRRPGTRKLGLGRIILPRDDSRDARFFHHKTSQNAYLYLGFVVY